MDAVNRIFDFFRPLGHTKEPAKQARVQGTQGRRSTKPGPTHRKNAPGDSFQVLQENAGLYFRVQATCVPVSWTVTFEKSFNTVWERLPQSVKLALLRYWAKPEWRLFGDQAPPHKPLILVVDGALSEQICNKFGHELTFPITLMEQHPDGVAFEIVRVLAQVFRMATRRHWRLILELIEHPLEVWEACQPKEVTDEARDRKLDVLEAEYLRVYHAEMADLLRNWGFASPPQCAMTT